MLVPPHATKHALIPKEDDFHEASIITAGNSPGQLIQIYIHRVECPAYFSAPAKFLSKPTFLERIDLRGHQDITAKPTLVQ